MRLWYRFWQVGSQIVFSAFFQVRVWNRENVPLTGPVLLLCNHQSFLDPILCGLGLHRELDYIARDSLFHNKYFGWYISSLNAFPIQRDQADIHAIKTVIHRLQNNRAIVMFPEATRTRDGRIRPVKGGFDLIARRAGATIVPAVVDGAFEAWPRHQKLMLPGRIGVMYGKPIPPDAIRNMSREEFIRIMNQTLRQMQTELRIQYQRKPYDYSDCVALNADPGESQ